MITDYTVSNYKSIEEEILLSFCKDSPVDEKNKNKLINIENGKYQLYPFVCIYGHNGSGKSNIIGSLKKNIEIFRTMINKKIENKKYEYSNTERSITDNQLEFYINDTSYIFEIKHTGDSVVGESLEMFKNGKNETLFNVDSNNVVYNENYAQAELMNILMSIQKKFIKKIRFIDNNTDFYKRNIYISELVSKNIDEENTQIVIDLYERLGYEIENIKKIKEHKKDVNYQKILFLIYAVAEALRHGEILVIDDFSPGLSTTLSQSFIKLFLNPEININNAQLLITSHDTNIVNDLNLDREQIYITNKIRECGTELYSLCEFKNEGGSIIANNFSKLYLGGRLNGIRYYDADSEVEKFIKAVI